MSRCPRSLELVLLVLGKSAVLLTVHFDILLIFILYLGKNARIVLILVNRNHYLICLCSFHLIPNSLIVVSSLHVNRSTVVCRMGRSLAPEYFLLPMWVSDRHVRRRVRNDNIRLTSGLIQSWQHLGGLRCQHLLALDNLTVALTRLRVLWLVYFFESSFGLSLGSCCAHTNQLSLPKPELLTVGRNGEWRGANCFHAKSSPTNSGHGLFTRLLEMHPEEVVGIRDSAWFSQLLVTALFRRLVDLLALLKVPIQCVHVS